MDRDLIVVVIGFILIMVVGFFAFKSYSDCKEKGGAWVDGVVWYECVESAK